MTSVSEMIRPLADAKQQFICLQSGWVEFLNYLKARNGADIRGSDRMTAILGALEYAEGNSDDMEEPTCRDRTDWFREFEKRDDVVAACRVFLRGRGLPCT